MIQTLGAHPWEPKNLEAAVNHCNEEGEVIPKLVRDRREWLTTEKIQWESVWCGFFFFF